MVSKTNPITQGKILIIKIILDMILVGGFTYLIKNIIVSKKK